MECEQEYRSILAEITLRSGASAEDHVVAYARQHKISLIAAADAVRLWVRARPGRTVLDVPDPSELDRVLS